MFRTKSNWVKTDRSIRSRSLFATKLVVCVLSATLASAVPASAQSWDDRDAFFGTGTLRYQNRTTTMLRAGIRRADNSVNIRLRTHSGEVHVLDGRFSRDVSGGYEATITLLDGEDATGLLFVGTRGELRTRRVVQPRRNRDQLTVTFFPDERASGSAKPNAPELTLNEGGAGSILIHGRRSEEVDRVSVRTRRDGSADVSISGTRSLRLEFRGQIVRNDGGSLNIRVSSSGEADATGSIVLRYQRSRLESLEAAGTLDGQRFTISFHSLAGEAGGSSELVLSQRGSGVLEIAGRPREQLAMAGVTVRRDGTTEIRLTRRNGSVFELSGRTSRRDAYSLRVSLRASGQADANGSASIGYGARGRINSLSVDGHVDGQSVTVYFAP
ncbi:MAG: hypothetical protein IPF53_00210 [Blastocatellia bacterium]|nr:hypothetical protein [Blastocatellia bacterium]